MLFFGPLSRATLLASLAGLPTACSGESAPDRSTSTSDTSNEAGASAEGGTLYQAVEQTVMQSCAFFRCHGGTAVIGANLSLNDGQSLLRALVNIPSCEYPLMMRVRPGDPDHSWIMVKLRAPVADTQSEAIEFTPDSSWDGRALCRYPSADGGSGFGLRMPATGQFQLDPAGIEAIRAWIEAGAPGPG